MIVAIAHPDGTIEFAETDTLVLEPDEVSVPAVDEYDDTAGEPSDYDARFDALSLAIESAGYDPDATHEAITACAEEFHRWLTKA